MMRDPMKRAGRGARSARNQTASDSSHLSTELRIVSTALAWPRDEARNLALRSLCEGVVDWPRVLRLVERHRVVGLVQHALACARITPSPAIAAALQRRAQDVAFEELAIAAELSRLERRFADLRLRPVVVKGLSAAMQGFGRLGLRQNRDIDLLVASDELAAVGRALEQDGYDQVEPAEQLSHQALEAWISAHKDVVYRHPASGIIIEVHGRLFDNRRFATGLGGFTPVELALPTGVAVRALPMETSLAYMSAHGAQHAWSRLKWLADFGALCAALGPARVTELYDEFKRSGLGLAAGQAFLLAGDLLGLPVPTAVTHDARRSWRLRTLRKVALRAIGDEELAELEDQTFGSTLKTLSHYLLNGGAAYWLSQAWLDFSEVPKSHASPWMRRLGPFAKVPLWIYVRLRRSR